MRLRRDKNGDAVGRPSWESSFLGDPGAKFLRGKLGIGTERKKEHERKEGVSFHRSHNHNPTHEELPKSREHLSQSRCHAPTCNWNPVVFGQKRPPDTARLSVRSTQR